MSNATPEELASAVSQPGTFSFMERLLNRNYPKDTVEMYLDESLGYKLRQLEEKLSLTTNKDQVKALEDELFAVREGLKGGKYTLHLEGISNEKYDELIDKAAELYPHEYDESNNPFTGSKVRSIKEEPLRDEYFTDLLWSHVVRKITDPSGATNEPVTEEDARAIRKYGPREGILRVAETVDKLRMAVQWMHYIQDEDFFPKP